jgi:hypothetical protein
MKRFLVTILSILYMASATGAVVHVHYCMGKLIGASFVTHEEAHKCGRCGMEKSAKGNGCCKDDYKIIKAGDQHLFAKTILNNTIEQPVTFIPLVSFYITQSLNWQTADSLAAINAPPPEWSACPIYLQVRNLRI